MSKSNLEVNKITAAILLASLIAMVVGTVSNILYKPKLKIEDRGYKIEVSEEEDTAAPEAETANFNIAELMEHANAESGKNIAKKCLSCHSFEKGGADKVGPNLWGVVGGPKAHRPSFTYSTALKTAGGKWEIEDIAHFLNKPSKYLPGTKMSFVGLKNPKDIVDVIAYLKSNAD